jgi:hypothetical protein
MEEREGEVVVRLNTLVGSTGFGVGGEGRASPQVMPYPFPDD